MKVIRKSNKKFYILGVIILLAVFAIIFFVSQNSLKKDLCSYVDNHDGIYPAWFVDHTDNNGKIVYAFSGYSATTEDVLINGIIHYNYREATATELKNRFIDNKVYFIYSNNEISLKQIKSFENDDFWKIYQSSKLTIKCH